jgi:hypothetical protein
LDHFVDLIPVFGEAFERPPELFVFECMPSFSAGPAPEGLEQFGRYFVDRNAPATPAPDFARIPRRAFASRAANLPDLARSSGLFGASGFALGTGLLLGPGLVALGAGLFGAPAFALGAGLLLRS